MGMIPTRRRGCWGIISGVIMSSDLIYPKLLKRYAEPWPSPPPPRRTAMSSSTRCWMPRRGTPGGASSRGARGWARALWWRIYSKGEP